MLHIFIRKMIVCKYLNTFGICHFYLVSFLTIKIKMRTKQRETHFLSPYYNVCTFISHYYVKSMWRLIYFLFWQLGRHPDDIDLFAGGLSERRLPGALLGPTFFCILAFQFKQLREGDSFWYENPHPIHGFTTGNNQFKIFVRKS